MARKQRSSYRCYSWYIAGDPTSPLIRLKVTGSRVSPDMDAELRSRLPARMEYPIDDIEAMKKMVDAVLGCHVKELRDIRDSVPEHIFGFESYLEYLEHHVIHVKQTTLKKAFGVPYDKKIQARDRLLTTGLDALTLDFNVLRYRDGDAWGELVLRKDRVIFTRAFMDLVTEKITVSHHFPSRYTAHDLDPKPYLEVLGSPTHISDLLIRPVDRDRALVSKTPIR